MTRWLVFVAVLCGLPLGARAETGETTELAVNGPERAVLLLDGRRVGTLPLASSLSVPAGEHRFRLELGSQKLDSESLTLPANRQAELTLSASGRTLLAILRITPGVLLLIGPDSIAAPLRKRLTSAIATAVRQEHAFLLSDKQDAILSKNAALAACLAQSDCHNPVLQDGQVAYVVSLRVQHEEAGGTGPCLVRAALLDTRTRDFSAHAETRIASCTLDALTGKTAELTAQLLRDTVVRPRGTLSVRSEPSGAKVLVDDRWLGTTPLSHELFTGPHTLEIQRDRYLSHKREIRLEPGQITETNAALVRDPAARYSRPLPRIIGGSVLMGGGLLLTSLGAAFVATSGLCQLGPYESQSCPNSYDTRRDGVGLLGSGLVLAAAGTIIIAIPTAKRPR